MSSTQTIAAVEASQGGSLRLRPDEAHLCISELDVEVVNLLVGLGSMAVGYTVCCTV